MKEQLRTRFTGHVVIRDAVTREVILDRYNAVHPQNMALALARSLAHDPDGYVFTMAFGNGGTFFNGSGQIVYRSPNTTGAATLYNETYSVQVDESNVDTPPSNSVTASASPDPSITSIVTITAVLSPSEPPGEAAADNITTDPEAPYMFDEIGLLTQDNLLLSHLIFSPIEKTANRAFLISYTLTISVS